MKIKAKQQFQISLHESLSGLMFIIIRPNIYYNYIYMSTSNGEKMNYNKVYTGELNPTVY